MSCRFCTTRPNQTFPPEIFILALDGEDALPQISERAHLFLDENIHERLSCADLPVHYQELKGWLKARNGRGLSAMSATVAVEHTLSTHAKPVRHVCDIMRDINVDVLGERVAAIKVWETAGLGPINAFALIIAEVLVSMAEIAWLKNLTQAKRHQKTCALENSLEFLEWRSSALPAISPGAATPLVLATIAGNANASDCLKLSKLAEGTGRFLKNAAFDAVHLSHFLNAALVGATLNPPQRAVFITADRALARFLKNPKLVGRGRHRAVGFDFDKPWLKQKSQSAEVMVGFHSQVQCAMPTVPREMGRAAKVALYDLCGGQVLEVNRMYQRLIDLL